MSKKVSKKIPTRVYTKFYRTFVNLYGAISSLQALDIIKIFYPEVRKSHFIEDLKARCDRQTKGYKIVKATKGVYIICNENFSFDDLDKIFEIHGNKPCYVIGPVDKYLAYSSPTYIDNIAPYQGIIDFYKDDTYEEITISEILINLIHKCIMNGDDSISFGDIVEKLEFINPSEIDFLVNQYEYILDHSRLVENNGFTNAELEGDDDLDAPGMSFSISEDLKEDLLSGRKSVNEVISLINDIEMPSNMKDTLISQIEGKREDIRNREA